MFAVLSLYSAQTSALPVSRLQLLRIEEELGAAAVYAGAKFRAPVEPY